MSRVWPTVAVIVPTYRRPVDLARCLDGLARQVRAPDQLIIVARSDDYETLAVLARSTIPHTLTRVSEAGQIPALKAGLRSVDTDIVAFTDDDAVPRADWISRLLVHFADPSVGGVGGRDVIGSEVSQPLSSRVGTLGSWGRLIGNHHVGTGGPRHVDVLKGVNMAFRRHLVRLPSGMGEGAQIHDLAVSLWVRRQGWQLIYDPALIVDHYPAVRYTGTPRANPPARAIREEAYSHTAALLATGMVSPLRLLVYGVLFGDRAFPGPGRFLLGSARGEAQELVHRVIPALRGRFAAHRAYLRGDRLGYGLP
jgi:glycosyltransferase involved in cell wall biosynthesis